MARSWVSYQSMSSFRVHCFRDCAMRSSYSARTPRSFISSRSHSTSSESSTPGGRLSQAASAPRLSRISSCSLTIRVTGSSSGQRFAAVPASTRVLDLSGKIAAKRIAMGPPADEPITCVLSTSRWSSNWARSLAWFSRSYPDSVRVDRQQPRRSYAMNRKAVAKSVSQVHAPIDGARRCMSMEGNPPCMKTTASPSP